MIPEDFPAFVQVFCGPAKDGQAAGLYAHLAVNTRRLRLWYEALKAYPLQAACRALTEAYKADPRHEPAIATVVEAIKAQAPPTIPEPPWWTPEIAAAVHAHGINGAFEVLRAQQQDADWRACHLAMKDEELTRPGREAAYLARCRQYAAQYPADRQSWHNEIARVEARLRQEGRPVPRQTPPPTAGRFTHVSAPRPRRTHDAHD